MFFLAFVSTCEHRPANLSVSRVSAQCSSAADKLRLVRWAGKMDD